MDQPIPRSDIKIGMFVSIVQKHHQGSGELTDGFVKSILTKAPIHPHGIKVILDTNQIGRVKLILNV